jgi:hypothetical protein
VIFSILRMEYHFSHNQTVLYNSERRHTTHDLKSGCISCMSALVYQKNTLINLFTYSPLRSCSPTLLLRRTKERKRNDARCMSQNLGSQVLKMVCTAAANSPFCRQIIPSALLSFPVFSEHREHVLKGSVNLFAVLSSSENNLARDKNEKHNLWLLHPVNQPREELWLILQIKQVNSQNNDMHDEIWVNDTLIFIRQLASVSMEIQRMHSETM